MAPQTQKTKGRQLQFDDEVVRQPSDEVSQDKMVAAHGAEQQSSRARSTQQSRAEQQQSREQQSTAQQQRWHPGSTNALSRGKTIPFLRNKHFKNRYQVSSCSQIEEKLDTWYRVEAQTKLISILGIELIPLRT